VWLVPLASIDDAALVAMTIVTTLGLVEIAGQTPFEQVVAHIGNQTGLLVLDNFEQVVAAAPLVAGLLDGCPELTILVTSRVSLRLVGEHEYLVQPLSLMVSDRLPSLEQLAEVEAVALFVQRAGESHVGFRLTDDNAAAVLAICRHLDGLPLAIELAAARTKLLAPATLLARLDRQLAVLTGGPRDAPSRQQTMRDAIAWSYALLTPDQQRVLRRLSIFAGGWTLEAAEAIDPDGSDVFSGLSELLNQSLIQQRELAEGTTRFAMLETIRAFGLEQLEDHAEHDAIAARHAAWLVRMVEHAAEAMGGPENEQAIERLDQEIDNLRAAWRWLEQHPDAAGDLIARLLRSQQRAWVFWRGTGREREGQQRILALLAAGDPPPSARASALNAAGLLANELNDAEYARTLLDEALTIARQQADQVGAAQALFGLGRTDANSGDPVGSLRRYEEALTAARIAGAGWLQKTTLINLSRAALAVGDREQARGWAVEALALDRARGGSPAEGTILGLLGVIAFQIDGDLAAATALQRQGLAILRSTRPIGRSRFVAELIDELAKLALAGHMPERAARLFGAAAARFEAIAIPFPAADKAVHTQILAEAQAALGDEAWNRAWAAGHALSINDAVAYALEEPLPESDATQPPTATTQAALLSRRELDVLRLVAEGKSDREIASALFISHHTVMRHVSNILGKLGVESRTAAATYAVRHNLH
jgi:non-specific serine/threonine protein kinase